MDLQEFSRLCAGMHDEEDEVRRLFTEIGCLMEDASIVALIWSGDDGLNARQRLDELKAANQAIAGKLAEIDRLVG